MYGQRGERERERMIDRDAKRHDYNTLRKKVDWFRWTVASTNYLLKDALPPPPPTLKPKPKRHSMLNPGLNP